MNVEELDRLSVLLEDAYSALNAAWEIPVRAGDHTTGHKLLLATVYVKDAAERLDAENPGHGYSLRVV